jgi:hypothetical protein
MDSYSVLQDRALRALCVEYRFVMPECTALLAVPGMQDTELPVKGRAPLSVAEPGTPMPDAVRAVLQWANDVHGDHCDDAYCMLCVGIQGVGIMLDAHASRRASLGASIEAREPDVAPQSTGEDPAVLAWDKAVRGLYSTATLHALGNALAVRVRELSEELKALKGAR